MSNCQYCGGNGCEKCQYTGLDMSGAWPPKRSVPDAGMIVWKLVNTFEGEKSQLALVGLGTLKDGEICAVFTDTDRLLEFKRVKVSGPKVELEDVRVVTR